MTKVKVIITATADSLNMAVDQFETQPFVEFNMDLTLAWAQDAFKHGNKKLGNDLLSAFVVEANDAQKHKSLTAAQAAILINIASELKE